MVRRGVSHFSCSLFSVEKIQRPLKLQNLTFLKYLKISNPLVFATRKPKNLHPYLTWGDNNLVTVSHFQNESNLHSVKMSLLFFFKYCDNQYTSDLQDDRHTCLFTIMSSIFHIHNCRGTPPPFEKTGYKLYKIDGQGY